MLNTIAVILIAMWLLGFASSYTIGGFIHILLVVAIVIFLYKLIQGRNLLGKKA
jgi:asparagine N-glycosylation enzyme membrane subunit Stt3